MDKEFADAVDAFRRGDLHRARAIAQEAGGSVEASQWQHLLGLIDCRLGNPAEGVSHLAAAVGGEPDNLGYRVMLARALVDAGRASEVLDMPVPSAASSPGALALWQARAEAAEEASDAVAAAQAWEIIAAAGPDDYRAWINCGRSLLRLDRFDAAEEAYKRALALAPADIDAIHELALLYERTSRIDDMAWLLDSAALRGVGKDRIPLAWASLEQRRGNSAEARVLLAKPGSERDPVRRHRLEVRVEESLGNSAVAFEAAAAMNRATADVAGWRRRAAAYREQLRELAETITDSWAAAMPKLEPHPRMPVFLVGFPRSGTTLLDTFLMGHRDIAVIEERPLLHDAGALLGPLEAIPATSEVALRQAREHYLRRLADELQGSDAAVAIDKFPLNMVNAPLTHALFPGAPIIFAKRHPCDSVLSGFMQSFATNLGMASFLDLADAADLFDACMSVWTASCEQLALNVVTVGYEELLADPGATLRPVIDFLGLEWDERLLDHIATATKRGSIGTTSYDQVTEPLTKAPIFRWRRYRKQMEPVLPVLLPWAERLGYED